MLTVYAGTGDPGFTGDGGPATSAQFYCPYGMAFGPDGALYVADNVNNRIRRIDTAGTVTTVVGSGPTGLGQGFLSGDGGPATEATLQKPTAIAFDRAGNLYISDRFANRIRKVDTKAMISTIAGNGTTGASKDGVLGPAQVSTRRSASPPTREGDVIFVDGANVRVRMVDRTGSSRRSPVPAQTPRPETGGHRRRQRSNLGASPSMPPATST